MKTIILGLALLSLVSVAFGADKAELNDQVRALTAKFEVMEQTPDKRVPAEVLRKAQGIILLDCTKAGFMFAFQGGNGVTMVRDKWGNWSPVAFLTANEASFGFQAGGEQNFYVILLMNTNATRALIKPTIDFGGEAQGTAGNNSSAAEGKIASSLKSVLVYSDRNGFYAGAAMKAGSIMPDDKANTAYYGQDESMSEILFDRKLEPTQAAFDLAKKIKTYSKK